MNNPLHKLEKEAQLIRLSGEEKRLMHARLLRAMEESPISENISRKVVPQKSPYFFFGPQFAMPFAALLILIVGSTTAYAAQRALPGEPLYAVKTGITEPVREALAFSVEAKAEYHAQVSEARLEEAEALAAQGRLTGAVSAELALNLSEHLNKAQELNATLQEDNAEAAEEVAAKFDSSISAHNEILARLGNKSKDEATRENLGTLATIAGVRSNQQWGAARATMAFSVQNQGTDMAAPAPENSNVAVNLSIEAASVPPPALQKTATSAKGSDERAVRNSDKAAKEIEKARAKLAKLSARLATTTAAQVEAQINAAQTRLDEGDTLGALRDAVRISTFITASINLDHGILTNLLEGRNDDEGEYNDRE